MLRKIFTLLALTALLVLFFGCTAMPSEAPDIILPPGIPEDTKQEADVRAPEHDVTLVPTSPQAVMAECEAQASRAFHQYLSENPPFAEAVQAAVRVVSRDDLGRTVLQFRSTDGGILPISLDALVFDPTAGSVAPQYRAWFLQGGYRTAFEDGVALSAPTSGMSVWIPAEMAPYASIELGDRASCLFSFSMKSSDPAYAGRLAELYSEPLAEFSAWDWGIYPRWSESTMGARGYEIARDDQAVYMLAFPTGLEFNAEDEVARDQYTRLAAICELIADQFALTNPVVTNPLWLWPTQGFTQNASGLRMFLNSILLERDRAIVTLPAPFNYALSGSDFEAWEIMLRGQRLSPDGRTEAVAQSLDKLVAGQAYSLELQGMKNAALTVSLPGLPVLTVQLQPRTGYFDYKSIRENITTPIIW